MPSGTPNNSAPPGAPPNALPVSTNCIRALIAMQFGARGVRDIGKAVGVSSPSTAHGIVKALEAAELVTQDTRKPGSLRPLVGLALPERADDR